MPGAVLHTSNKPSRRQRLALPSHTGQSSRKAVRTRENARHHGSIERSPVMNVGYMPRTKNVLRKMSLSDKDKL